MGATARRTGFGTRFQCLSVKMLEDLKVLANKRDVPYQSPLKMYVAERIDEELRTSKL